MTGIGPYEAAYSADLARNERKWYDPRYYRQEVLISDPRPNSRVSHLRIPLSRPKHQVDRHWLELVDTLLFHTLGLTSSVEDFCPQPDKVLFLGVGAGLDTAMVYANLNPKMMVGSQLTAEEWLYLQRHNPDLTSKIN